MPTKAERHAAKMKAIAETARQIEAEPNLPTEPAPTPEPEVRFCSVCRATNLPLEVVVLGQKRYLLCTIPLDAPRDEELENLIGHTTDGATIEELVYGVGGCYREYQDLLAAKTAKAAG